MTNSPLERYQQALRQGEVVPDQSQAFAVNYLDELWRQLVARESQKQVGAMVKILGRVRSWARGEINSPIQGLYLWGGVGRGKTWLMDMFYESLPGEKKLRTHFHRFMRRVHAELKLLSGVKNPLERVAEVIAKEASIICFDEFFVSDITDAMILANLMDALFKRRVILVATSNVEPLYLYKDGLQRARFVPAIELLNKHTKIINVDGETDYRLRALKQADLYYSPLGESAHRSLALCFERLVPDINTVCANVELEIEGRTLLAYREAEDVAWFLFEEVCDGPRSQNDYIELAREYHAVVLENVPLFTGLNDDQARRFINLIDEFYDRNVKLIMSSERPPTELYQDGQLHFEFARTQSRLQEMQSHAFLARAHKAS